MIYFYFIVALMPGAWASRRAPEGNGKLNPQETVAGPSHNAESRLWTTPRFSSNALDTRNTGNRSQY